MDRRICDGWPRRGMQKGYFVLRGTVGHSFDWNSDYMNQIVGSFLD